MYKTFDKFIQSLSHNTFNVNQADKQYSAMKE